MSVFGFVIGLWAGLGMWIGLERLGWWIEDRWPSPNRYRHHPLNPGLYEESLQDLTLDD